MPTYTSPFTGTVVQPTDVSYYNLTLSANTQLYWPAVVNPTQVPAPRILDCTATTGSLVIALPQGDEGSVGTDILIRNQGAVAFSVTDSAGNNAVSVAAGASIYFYLVDNTTVAGTWHNVAFGTGTSSADAASLRGAGLTVTSAGLLATTGTISRVSSSPTLNDSSRAITYVWTAGAGTFTLPANTTLSSGWYMSFRNAGTGTLTIQVNGSTSNQINDGTSIVTNPGDSGTILFDSTTGNFYTVGWTTANNISFTAATYDLDSIIGSTYSLVSNAPIIQTYVALSGTRTTPLTVTLPNITQLYVLINESSTISITFNVSGGAGTITIAPNQVVAIVVDAGAIFTITQSSTTTFAASNGSAASPSYYFASDSHTGMYLVGTSVLGFSANSQNILRLDYTSISNPQVTTPALFTATGGIQGGTF
jgi:hypothetical protein